MEAGQRARGGSEFRLTVRTFSKREPFVRTCPRQTMTLDRYAHWMPSMGRATAEAIDAALG